MTFSPTHVDILADAPTGFAGARSLADTVHDTSVRRLEPPARGARLHARDVTDSLWYGIYVTRLVTDGGNARALAAMRVQRVDSAPLDEPAWSARLAAAVSDTAARARGAGVRARLLVGPGHPRWPRRCR